MRRKAFKAFICFVLCGAVLLAVSGCWDALDVEDRDICTAVVVDKEDDDLVFYVEIPDIASKMQNTSEQDSGQSLSASVVKGSGKTFAEARMSLDRALNKPIYLGAVQSLVLTERMADSGIDEYTLRVRQMTDYRKTMDVIVTPDDAESFLNVNPSNQATVGFAIEDTLETLTQQGLTYHFSLSDLLQKLESRNPCYLVNTLAIRDGQVKLIGSTVFDGGRRIGYIPFEESRGITILSTYGTAKAEFNYVVNAEGHAFTLETKLKKKTITPGYDGEKPTFDIMLRFDAVNLFPSDRLNINDDIRRQIAETLKEKITGEILQAIEQSQKEFTCDYLSFNRPFRIHYPTTYESLNWHDAFGKATFNVDVSVKEIPSRAIDYEHKPALP